MRASRAMIGAALSASPLARETIRAYVEWERENLELQALANVAPGSTVGYYTRLLEGAVTRLVALLNDKNVSCLLVECARPHRYIMRRKLRRLVRS